MSPRRLQPWLSQRAGFEPRRLLMWILAYSGLSAAWIIEDGQDWEDEDFDLSVAELAAAQLGL